MNWILRENSLLFSIISDRKFFLKFWEGLFNLRVISNTTFRPICSSVFNFRDHSITLHQKKVEKTSAETLRWESPVGWLSEESYSRALTRCSSHFSFYSVTNQKILLLNCSYIGYEVSTNNINTFKIDLLNNFWQRSNCIFRKVQLCYWYIQQQKARDVPYSLIKLFPFLKLIILNFLCHQKMQFSDGFYSIINQTC